MWKVCQWQLLLHVALYEFLWLTDNRAYLQLLNTKPRADDLSLFNQLKRWVGSDKNQV